MPFQTVKRIAIIRYRQYSWYILRVAVFSLLMAITVRSFSKSMRTPISPSIRDNNDNDYSIGNTQVKQEKPYRQGIMAVFTDSQRERVLLCKRKRSSKKKKAEWQFPQGGIETTLNELPKEALYREVSEELGNNQFRVVQQATDFVRYDFPQGRNVNLRYRGQEHVWFLCEYRAEMGPELHRAVDDDFEECEWVDPQQAVERVTPWKRPAYIVGLQQLGYKVTQTHLSQII